MTDLVCPAAPADASACLGCSYLESQQARVVTLETGQEVCNYCPSWRDECARRHEEAKALLRMPDREARLDRLAEIGAARGPEARSRLVAAVLDLWEKRRARSQPAEEATQ